MSVTENKQIPIPEKEEGSHKDIEAKEETDTIGEAKQLFEKAKARLLQVNEWDSIAGKASAIFKLTDEKGREIEGKPKPGYYLKIDIPAPGTEVGEGFDWVKVEAIEENSDSNKDDEYLVMTVRPSSNPLNAGGDVAHFLSGKATSSFIILREKKVVFAAVIGRNEVANTNDSGTLIDKIRNAIVGTGAIGGFSNAQWKNLVNGILDKH